MSDPKIRNLQEGFHDISEILSILGEVSLQTTLEDVARKALIVAGASYYENRLTQTVYDFCNEAARGNQLLMSVVQIKAISRQYHTWFDWKTNNASIFFALFGETFKTHMKTLLDDKLEDSIAAFMEIGRERNKLLHNDFSAYTVEKTVSEISSLIEEASLFVSVIPDELRKFVSKQQMPDLEPFNKEDANAR